jgi:hypothetical protein
VTRIIIALLTGASGVVMLLVGLGIDAWLHAEDETLAAREGIFTLSNPGHALLALGMALATGGILTALHFAWGMSTTEGIFGRRWVRVITMQASGGAAIGAVIFALAVSAAGHEHSHADATDEAHKHDLLATLNVSTTLETDAPASDAAPHSHEDPMAALTLHPHDDVPATDARHAAPTGTPFAAQAHTHANTDVLSTEALTATLTDQTHMHPADTMTAAGAAGAHTHPAPTADERQCFADLTAEAKIATERFADVNVAIAEGYLISDDPADTHMPNRAYMRDGRSLDLAYPESLIYATDANGERRFVGALYRSLKGHGPTPCGNATFWHTHGRCIASDGTSAPESKDKTCPAGYEHRDGAIEMMHIWYVPRGQRS